MEKNKLNETKMQIFELAHEKGRVCAVDLLSIPRMTYKNAGERLRLYFKQETPYMEKQREGHKVFYYLTKKGERNLAWMKNQKKNDKDLRHVISLGEGIRDGKRRKFCRPRRPYE